LTARTIRFLMVKNSIFISFHPTEVPTMKDFLSLLSAEATAILSAADKREAAIGVAEKLFDEFVAKIDLPGPDAVIDPLLRAAIRPLVGRIYDEILKKLEVPAHA
jgi:hypothetical protein